MSWREDKRGPRGGGLNDAPESDPLAPLLGLGNLHDVLELQFPQQPEECFTYHYNRNEQINYARPRQADRDAASEKQADPDDATDGNHRLLKEQSSGLRPSSPSARHH